MSWECSANTNGKVVCGTELCRWCTFWHSEWILRHLFSPGNSQHCTGFIQSMVSVLATIPNMLQSMGVFSALHAWSLPLLAELLLLHCLWYSTYQMRAQCKQVLPVLQLTMFRAICTALHVAQDFCVDPVWSQWWSVKGCICSDFRLHEKQSHSFQLVCLSHVRAALQLSWYLWCELLAEACWPISSIQLNNLFLSRKTPG